MRLLFVDLVTHLFHYVQLAELGGGGVVGACVKKTTGGEECWPTQRKKIWEVTVCRLVLNKNSQCSGTMANLYLYVSTALNGMGEVGGVISMFSNMLLHHKKLDVDGHKVVKQCDSFFPELAQVTVFQNSTNEPSNYLFVSSAKFSTSN